MTETKRDDPKTKKPSIFSEIVKRPVITLIIVACVILGIGGSYFVFEDWSMLRRIGAGVIGGVGVGFLITATRITDGGGLNKEVK